MHRAIRHITDAKDFGKVAVLYGGSSAEREVSLMSGAAVHKGLLEKQVDAHLVDYSDVLPHQLVEQGFNRVWIALHGRGGEDGSLQGALEQLGLPYTGSGVLGSALGLDKLRSKQVFKAEGLLTPDWITIFANDKMYSADEISEKLGLPLVVKPALEGSSIGMSIVKEVAELEPAIKKALAADKVVLVEQFIQGKEITSTILQNEALPLIYIEPVDFYDYDAKYFSDETQYHCPCGLDVDLEKDIQVQSLKAFKAIDAFGWGRADFLLDEDNKAWLLEVNTVPGMTSHSLVPMSAKQAGYSFSDLVWKVLESSFLDSVMNDEVAA